MRNYTPVRVIPVKHRVNEKEDPGAAPSRAWVFTGMYVESMFQETQDVNGNGIPAEGKVFGNGSIYTRSMPCDKTRIGMELAGFFFRLWEPETLAHELTTIGPSVRRW